MEKITFTAKQVEELEEFETSMFNKMLQFKDTKLDAMYRFWIGEMTWQEQVSEVHRVLSLELIFPDRIAKSEILDKHFKIVRLK